MQYYPFDISDYYNSTRHLQPDGHYIYRSLLDMYYEKESPLQLDKRYLLRRIGCTSDQIDVLEAVLDDFFEMLPDGYHNKRCDQELAIFHDYIDSQKCKGVKSGAARRANRKKLTAVKQRLNSGSTAVEPELNPAEPNKTKTKTKTKTKDISSADADSSAAAAEPINNKPKAKPVPYQKIIDIFHESCPMLPRVITITSTRKSAIRARWQGGMNNREFWENYFNHVAESDFLTGKKPPIPPRTKPMIADIDFLLRESTITFMQEGKYDN